MKVNERLRECEKNVAEKTFRYSNQFNREIRP